MTSGIAVSDENGNSSTFLRYAVHSADDKVYELETMNFIHQNHLARLKSHAFKNIREILGIRDEATSFDANKNKQRRAIFVRHQILNVKLFISIFIRHFEFSIN